MSKVLRALCCSAVFVVAASVVSAADVQVGINIPSPPVLTVKPPLVVVPNIPDVRYAPKAPRHVVHGGQYYAWNNNKWFAAPRVGAPWVVVERQRVPQQILVVPARYYKVPPGHLNKAHKVPPGHQKIPPGHLKHKKGHGHDQDDDGNGHDNDD
jgi:hypothetical protein